MNKEREISSARRIAYHFDFTYEFDFWFCELVIFVDT